MSSRTSSSHSRPLPRPEQQPQEGGLRWCPTQTHTLRSTYPKIHNRRGIDGLSCRLKIKTPVSIGCRGTPPARSGTVLLPSPFHSSSPPSSTRPVARRGNRVGPWRLGLRRDR
ncbi:unnamed protein product [Musa acuminata subsp. burmannicoides]